MIIFCMIIKFNSNLFKKSGKTNTTEIMNTLLLLQRVIILFIDKKNMDMYTYHVYVDTRKLSKIINAQFLMKITERKCYC